MDNFSSSTRSGLAWGFIQRAGSRGVAFVVFVYLARVLDPIDFGLVAAARVFVDYGEMAAGQGFGHALIQRKKLTNGHINTAFTLSLALAAALTLLIIGIAPVLEDFLDFQGISPVLTWLSVAIFLGVVTRIQIAIATRDLRFDLIAKIELCVAVTSGLIAIAMAILDYGVWSIVAMQLSAAVLNLVIYQFFSSWKPRFFFFDSCCARDLYQYSLKVVLAAHIHFASLKFGEIVISLLLGPVALGYYSVAKRFIDILGNVIFQVIEKVFMATFSRLQDNKPELRRYLVSSIRIGSLYITPVFVGSAIVAPDIVDVLFGEKWQDTVIPFTILALSGIALLPTHLFNPTYLSIGRPGIVVKLLTFRVCIGFALMPLLAPFGVAGIAIAITARDLIAGCVDGAYLQRTIGGKYWDFYRPQLSALMLTLPMAAVTYFSQELLRENFNTIVSLLLSISIGFVVFFATLLIFKVDYQFWRKGGLKR